MVYDFLYKMQEVAIIKLFFFFLRNKLTIKNTHTHTHTHTHTLTLSPRSNTLLNTEYYYKKALTFVIVEWGFKQ